jgi:hypothetical protein
VCGYVSCNSNVTSFKEIQSEFRRLALECYGNQADILKLYAGGTNAKANEYAYRPRKSEGNKTAKSYNLMHMMTGGKPITSWNDAQPGPTEGLKYYSGSSQQQEDKAASEKRRKSYELMRMITGCRYGT